MKLRKSKSTSGNRQRQFSNERMPVSSKYTYRSRPVDDSIDETSKAKPRQQFLRGNFWLQRLGLIVLLVAIVASVINILSLSSAVMILPTVTGQNISAQNRKLYTEAASHILSSSVLNSNKITVNTKELSQKLLKQFPDLDSLNVTIGLFSHQLTLYVLPAQPGLIFKSQSGTYLVDTRGKVTSSYSLANGSQTIPVVTDQSGLQPRINQQVLPSNYISFIRDVTAQLTAKNITVSNLVLPAASNELDVSIANQPYFVKFNLQNNDARQQAGTYLATLALLQSQHITPTSYIDVRVDGRAYYK